MTADDVKLIMTGHQKASEVDKEYAKDPTRKAKAVGIRTMASIFL